MNKETSKQNDEVSLAKMAAFRSALLTTALLAVGIFVVWVAQKQLGIQGESIFVALLLIPVLVYLLLTGKLGELKLPGVTLKAMKQELTEKISDVRKDVSDVSELEPARSAYLGKLRQIQGKDGVDFCLLYADVAGLRNYTRRLYLSQKSKTVPRRTEKEIRDTIIRNLAITLTDAFYDCVPEKKYRGAKHDIFFLEEPDVAMIIRKVPKATVQAIIHQGQKKFTTEHKCKTRMAFVSPIGTDKSPRDLDRLAVDKLADSVEV